MNIARVVPWAFALIIAIGVTLYGAVEVVSTLTFSSRGERAVATVSRIGNNYPALVFTDRFGNNHIKSFKHFLSGTLSDGQQVPVLFNPRNPDQATVDSFVFVWAYGIGVLALGFIIAIVAGSRFPWREVFVALGLMDPATLQTTAAGSPSASSTAVSSSGTYASATGGPAMSKEDLVGVFGPLKPLIEDQTVSDIILASPNAIFIKKNATVTKANVTFPSALHYERQIDRMLAVADCPYTVSKPIVDGMVTPLIRIHAVHKMLCEEGPYVTLRVSRVKSVKFADLCRGTLAPRPVHNYLRGMLLTGHTILIAGEVGTGKTTLIRALASTVPPQESILVIEDTPEIMIEHPAVRYVRTRDANTEGIGKVSPAECIRAGMRMAMNRIIFGEIRDPEAAESFIDVCVSGHPGLCTIHARSAQDVIARLELFLARAQPGVGRGALREQIGSAVQVIVYTKVCRATGQRRISEVIEIARGDDAHPLRIQEMFRYSASGDMPVWKVVNRQSFYETELREFESGSATLNNLSDWIQLSQ